MRPPFLPLCRQRESPRRATGVAFPYQHIRPRLSTTLAPILNFARACSPFNEHRVAVLAYRVFHSRGHAQLDLESDGSKIADEMASRGLGILLGRVVQFSISRRRIFCFAGLIIRRGLGMLLLLLRC